MDARLDGGMRAGEHQCKALVRDFCPGHRAHLFYEELQLPTPRLTTAASSGDIDHLSTSDSEQPGFRIGGTAITQPICQRRSERVRQGIFGLSHILRARREKGAELAVTATRNPVCCPTSLGVAFPDAHGSPWVPYAECQTGRTSTTPWPAVGQRAAHSNAASRSGTSIM